MSDSSAQKLRLEWVEAGSLTPNPLNWRRHPKKQMAALRDVIHDPDIGWAGVILFNSRTKRVVDGHARLKSVRPDEMVPVLIGDWSEDAERKILATLDPIGMLAETDEKSVALLLDGLDFNSDAVLDVLATTLGYKPGDAESGGGEQSEAAIEFEDVAEAVPPMTWVLLGLPTVRYGEIAQDIERLSKIDGMVSELSTSDAA